MSKPKRIAIVIEDDGKDQFNLKLEGDIGRLGTVPMLSYSPAEYWAEKLIKVCVECLNKSGSIQKMKKPKMCIVPQEEANI